MTRYKNIRQLQRILFMQRVIVSLLVLRYIHLLAVQKSSENRTKMIMPDGKVIIYKYDSNNRLIQLISDAGIFVFAYDSLGRRTKLTLPNGTHTTYSYDTNSRLTELVHKNSNGSVIDSFAYTHDNIGNRLTKTELNKKTTYTYDPLYRLTQALPTKLKGKYKEQENKAEIFSYDPVGNRLTSDHNRTYTYNAGNQLVIENGISYTYDKNGNLISKTSSEGTTTHVYDFENRLIKVATPNGTIAEFKYDPFGRRIEKKITENGITTTKRYFYDNEDILFEYDEQGNIGNRYIHGLGIDEPLALNNNQGTYYYHVDGLGSVVALTDSNQKVVQDYQYDSFGNLKDQKERIKQPYTFTAREWDKEIGLYYYRARYYDAGLGRFISFDPILHPANGSPKCRHIGSFKIPSFNSLLKNPQTLNPYNYTEQNPSNMVDPYGLMAPKPPTPSLGDFIPPTKLPCGKTADQYCGQEYIKKRNECALKPDVLKGCLQKAERWFVQCQTWANGIIYREIPCPPQDCKDK